MQTVLVRKHLLIEIPKFEQMFAYKNCTVNALDRLQHIGWHSEILWNKTARPTCYRDSSL